MNYLRQLSRHSDDEINNEENYNRIDVSNHHIAFVTRTLYKLIKFECIVADQFLHHCHLFYPKYEAIKDEDFSEHIKLLKNFENFLEEYRKKCQEYLLIDNEQDEKRFRKKTLKPLRAELFRYWYRLYNKENRESFSYYIFRLLILNTSAIASIDLEFSYLDFIYKYLLSEFSGLMSTLDTSQDSPLYPLHIYIIQEDYRHWYADLSFFHESIITDIVKLKVIISKNLLPKASDYESVNNNLKKLNYYITKIKATNQEIFDFIDG